MSPTETMRRYFATWDDRDFAAFQSLLADDVSFVGPLGSADGASACRTGIERMSQAIDGVEVELVLADGPDVLSWFVLRVPGVDPIPVANRARVQDGRVQQIRVTFDPRPFLT